MFSRALFGKTLLSVLAVIGLSLSSAPRQASADVSIPGCTNIIPLPGSLIYKGCAGSGHLSGDPRGRGVALIARLNSPFRAPSCIKVFDYEGNRISGLRLYAGNNGLAYKWRGYSNYVNGCGKGDTFTRMRSKSKNKEIYLQLAGGTCIKIPRSFMNINSSQRC
jgi:hypothetical protein